MTATTCRRRSRSHTSPPAWLLLTLGLTLGIVVTQVYHSLELTNPLPITLKKTTSSRQSSVVDHLTELALAYHQTATTTTTNADSTKPASMDRHHKDHHDENKRKKKPREDKPHNNNKQETKSDTTMKRAVKKETTKEENTSNDKKHPSKHKRVKSQSAEDGKKAKSLQKPLVNGTTTTTDSVLQKYWQQEDDSLVGDASELLDFAILGFSKSATSYMKDWLRQQPEISMSSQEVCLVNKKQGRKLLHHLSHELQPEKRRGLKCPSHFTRTSLDWYRQHFPRTKLVIGLRHPVSWFESFYNFRLRHPKWPNATLPQHVPELVGPCQVQHQGLCTDNAQFHRQLSRLAKTSLSPTERALLQLKSSDVRGLGTRRVSNPVFVYEISQLQHNSEALARDLGRFLDLRHPLAPYVEKHESKKEDKSTRLNICDSQYNAVRQELVQAAVATSNWVLDYFLPHVSTSDTETFVQAMKAWHQDPCETRSSKSN